MPVGVCAGCLHLRSPDHAKESLRPDLNPLHSAKLQSTADTVEDNLVVICRNEIGPLLQGFEARRERKDIWIPIRGAAFEEIIPLMNKVWTMGVETE